jgi:hypothetical protein
VIKFDKPIKINGEQLIQELNTVGIKVNSDPVIDGNGDFWLDISTKDKVKAELIVAAHVAKDTSKDKEATRQAIADRLGLTADELKLLLG